MDVNRYYQEAGKDSFLLNLANKKLADKGSNLAQFCEANGYPLNTIFSRLTAPNPSRVLVDEIFNQIDPSVKLKQFVGSIEESVGDKK